MAVTKEQIIEAATQLAADGANPSMAAVRKMLGGGSFSTISPILRDWRNSQEQVTAAILDMPAEIKLALEKAGAALWETASGLASREIEKIRQTADKKVGAATLNRNEAVQEIGRLEVQITELKSAFKAQHEQLESIRGQQTVAARREGALEADLAGARSSIETMKATIATQKTEMAEIAKSNVEYQKTIAGLEGRLAATLPSSPLRGTDQEVTKYFRRDLDASDQAEREKSARSHVRLLLDDGATFAAVAKKLNDEGYPTISDDKSLWTWQAVKKLGK